jgi:predicted house-cleaning NTP pyrophosphatase (Maf/HAM1 superfamily)
VSGVDEDRITSTDPANLAGALAQLKCRAVAAQVEPDALVIGCDSVLAFEGEIFGKPGGPVEATGRWRRMRGRSGGLLCRRGGVCVVVTRGRGVRTVGERIVRIGHGSRFSLITETGLRLPCDRSKKRQARRISSARPPRPRGAPA